MAVALWLPAYEKAGYFSFVLEPIAGAEQQVTLPFAPWADFYPEGSKVVPIPARVRSEARDGAWLFHVSSTLPHRRSPSHRHTSGMMAARGAVSPTPRKTAINAARPRRARRPLAGIRVVSIAQNLPGPGRAGPLAAEGATTIKVEPPDGDPMAGFSPAWYDELHQGVEVRRLDLKSVRGHAALHRLLGRADLFLASQRPAALARLGAEPPPWRARTRTRAG